MATLKDKKLVFKTNYPLMQVKTIAECSKRSILQYFRPSLSYHLSLRSLFCLFLRGCFTQVLLYQCSVRWKTAVQEVPLYLMRTPMFMSYSSNQRPKTTDNFTLNSGALLDRGGIYRSAEEEGNISNISQRLNIQRKTCVKQPLPKRQKLGFQDKLSLNAGQKYCWMLQGEHSAILLTFIKVPFVIKIFVLSFFEWPFYCI